MPVRIAPAAAARLTPRGTTPVRPDGAFVLYWMSAHRRLEWNQALQHALWWAEELARPLVVIETVHADQPWASVRHYRFFIQGCAANRAAATRLPLTYHPFVEAIPGSALDLIAALAAQACLLVRDDFPQRFQRSVRARLDRRLTLAQVDVDANGVLPLSASQRTFERAVDFRRFVQKELPPHLLAPPLDAPALARAQVPRLAALPEDVARRWPAADLDQLLAPGGLAALPIDQEVPAAPDAGGADAARLALRAFLAQRLDRYDLRNHPDDPVASGLSPWLAQGHLSAHQVALAVLAHAGWSPDRLAASASGGKDGWWGCTPAIEGFLDELITWRELSHHHSQRVPDDDRFESLPAWALATLAQHAGDARPALYSPADLEAGRTHDPLWNAAQRQLRAEGRMHGYLRMLWGKWILGWSADPRAAWDTALRLNDRWALDGGNPNSLGGVAWIFGRFDRPWAPQRPVFGCLRYMTSGSTVKKLHCRDYLARWTGVA